MIADCGAGFNVDLKLVTISRIANKHHDCKTYGCTNKHKNQTAKAPPFKLATLLAIKMSIQLSILIILTYLH